MTARRGLLPAVMTLSLALLVRLPAGAAEPAPAKKGPPPGAETGGWSFRPVLASTSTAGGFRLGLSYAAPLGSWVPASPGTGSYQLKMPGGFDGRTVRDVEDAAGLGPPLKEPVSTPPPPSVRPWEFQMVWGTPPRAAVHAMNGYTLYRLYGQGTDALLHASMKDKDKDPDYVPGRVTRFFKTFIWDGPLAWIDGLATHEAGHFEWGYMGGARKVSWDPASGNNALGHTSDVDWGSYTPTPAQRLAFNDGGVHASQTAADTLRRMFLAKDQVDWTYLPMFIAHKADITGYAIGSPPPDQAGPDNKNSDLVQYANLYGKRSGQSPRTVYNQILAGGLWNAADPLNFWALAAYFGGYVWQGKETAPNPLVDVGGAQLGLGTGFWLSEVGPLYATHVFVRDPKSGALVQTTLTTGDDGQFGVAARAAAIKVADYFRVNLGFDLWHQRAAAEPGPLLWGGAGSGGFELGTGKGPGVRLEGGYKTDGAMLGQPFTAGPFVMGGLSGSL